MIDRWMDDKRDAWMSSQRGIPVMLSIQKSKGPWHEVNHEVSPSSKVWMVD